MIDRAHDLPIARQAEALNISRGSVYYLPRPVPESDLAIMRRLDRLHLEYPFAGSRMLRGLLAAEGCKIGRRHVKTLMQRMGIEALYRRPRTTQARAWATRSIRICCETWRFCGSIRSGRQTSRTCPWQERVPVPGGCDGLAQPGRAVVATLKQFGRRVLSGGLWTRHCAANGKPEIFNTDQGVQFTSQAFTERAGAGGAVAISMDGRGRALGQRVRGTAVVEREVQERVSAGLRQRQRGSRFNRPLPGLLQRHDDRTRALTA